MSDWTIGIIGGSGLYAIDALEDAQWIPIQSPWGQPSDEVLCGTIGHVRVRFLPRHGRGHRIAPSTINARGAFAPTSTHISTTPIKLGSPFGNHSICR